MDGAPWAGEASSGNVDVQPAVLYPLAGKLEKDLSPQDGIALPGGLDFLESIAGRSIIGAGKNLWARDRSGRRLFWFDTQTRAVGGVLAVYPGDQPSAGDPRVMLSISYDDEWLWAGGTEILRIAIK